MFPTTHINPVWFAAAAAPCPPSPLGLWVGLPAPVLYLLSLRAQCPVPSGAPGMWALPAPSITKKLIKAPACDDLAGVALIAFALIVVSIAAVGCVGTAGSEGKCSSCGW